MAWKRKEDAPKDGTIILAMYSDNSGANPIRWGYYDSDPEKEGWFEADFTDEAFDDFEYWIEMPNENGPTKTLKDIRMNLEGVISDCEGRNGFDDVCLETVKRCSAQISTVMKQLHVPSGGKSDE